MRCNQMCRWNDPSDGCVKPDWAKCSLSNMASPEKPKTNFDWIRAMSDKELVEFIGHNSLCDRIQGEGTWCEEHAVCEICLAKWLQQPAKPSNLPDEDDRDSGLVEEE